MYRKERKGFSEHSSSLTTNTMQQARLIEVARDSKVIREYQYDAFDNRMRRLQVALKLYIATMKDQLISKREAESETTYIRQTWKYYRHVC